MLQRVNQFPLGNRFW